MSKGVSQRVYYLPGQNSGLNQIDFKQVYLLNSKIEQMILEYGLKEGEIQEKRSEIESLRAFVEDEDHLGVLNREVSQMIKENEKAYTLINEELKNIEKTRIEEAQRLREQKGLMRLDEKEIAALRELAKARHLEQERQKYLLRATSAHAAAANGLNTSASAWDQVLVESTIETNFIVESMVAPFK